MSENDFISEAAKLIYVSIIEQNAGLDNIIRLDLPVEQMSIVSKIIIENIIQNDETFRDSLNDLRNKKTKPDITDTDEYLLSLVDNGKQ